jgi:hypothetical protein
VCLECRLHEVTCKPQEPKAGNTTKEKCTPEAHNRLARIEALFQHVCKSAGIDVAADDLAGLEDAAFKIAEQLRLGRRRASTPPPGQGSLRTPENSSASPHQDAFTDDDREAGWSNAPLLDLARETMLVDNAHAAPLPTSDCTPAVKRNLSNHRRQFLRLLPSPGNLWRILGCTAKYWPLWPLHPSQLSPSEGLSISIESVGQSFIYKSIQGDTPGAMAKAVVWYALCVQQLPKDQLSLFQSVPHTALDLVLTCLEQSDAILEVGTNGGDSIRALECLVLQTKCYVNMGRPRRAWMSIRQALNKAMLLGLHQPGTVADPESVNVWATIWRLDRQLSVVLGLPDGISEMHPGLAPPSHDQPLELQIMHRMTMLCGSINRRNQHHGVAAYDVTMQLDEELDSLQQMFPAPWWDVERGDAMPLSVFHTRQLLKLYYYQLRQLVHLPYVSRAVKEKKYEYSRLAVLEAAEGMICAYRDRRLHPDGASVTCFLVDFQAFSSGLVLAIDLMSQSSDGSLEAERKWRAILYLASELRYGSTLLEHAVVVQAAQLLEYLYEAHHGIYDGPETYEAIIPYFGRVHIRKPKPRASLGEHVPGYSADPGVLSGVVELSSNIFSGTHGPDEMSGELDIDWAAILEPSVVYEWNGIFDFGQAS